MTISSTSGRTTTSVPPPLQARGFLVVFEGHMDEQRFTRVLRCRRMKSILRVHRRAGRRGDDAHVILTVDLQVPQRGHEATGAQFGQQRLNSSWMGEGSLPSP